MMRPPRFNERRRRSAASGAHGRRVAECLYPARLMCNAATTRKRLMALHPPSTLHAASDVGSASGSARQAREREDLVGFRS